MKNTFKSMLNSNKPTSGLKNAVREILLIKQQMEVRQKEFEKMKKETQDAFESGARRTKGRTTF